MQQYDNKLPTRDVKLGMRKIGTSRVTSGDIARHSRMTSPIQTAFAQFLLGLIVLWAVVIAASIKTPFLG